MNTEQEIESWRIGLEQAVLLATGRPVKVLIVPCEVAPPSAPPAVLSARERQIALMVSQGLSNLNVASRIGISEATVAVHLRTIYRKLEVHSRTQLANALRGRQAI